MPEQTDAPKRLWVIRHAKSSWAEQGISDYDRPLNARGTRDGPLMADWLARQDHHATWVWTSSAARALATARFVQQGFDLPESAIIALGELYHATPEQLLDVIRRSPPGVSNVALVAHNPGLTWLVNALCRKPQLDNLPTFGVARFSVQGAWQDLQPAHATLDWINAPKTVV